MKELTKVVLRIMSLYFMTRVLFAVNIAIFTLGNKKYNSGIHEWIYYIITILLFLAITVCLWVFNDLIATLILVNNKSVDFKLNISTEELFDIALRLFGLVLIITSIEPMAREAIKIGTINLDSFDIAIRAGYFISILYPTLKVAIGVILMLRKIRIKKTESIT